jgi:hypothetical protein
MTKEEQEAFLEANRKKSAKILADRQRVQDYEDSI